jgi:hypothetical protein
MRYEVVVSIYSLKLTAIDSRELLKAIQNIDGFEEGVRVSAGVEYDSNVEDEGEDSEFSYSEIKFYSNGTEEKASTIANKVVNQTKILFDFPETGLFFTLTEIENIISYL